MPCRVLQSSLLLLVLLACGCRNMEFTTRAIVSMEQPIRMQMQSDEGPVRPRPVEGDSAAAPQVAVIDIDGPLLNQHPPGALAGGDTAVSLFRERLKAAANAPTCAVVLRINSPGGSVTATEIMVRELRQFKAETGLPVVACLMDIGTGGAYYLATSADAIVAHPTTITGGVGVIVNLFNLRETMAMMNVFEQSIKSGPHIDMGTSTRQLDEATQAMLQQISDDFHGRFIAAVRSARPRLKNEADVFSGRIFHGPQALENGLVDQVGFLDDAIEVAQRLGGCPTAQVVMYRRGCDLPYSMYETAGGLPSPSTLLPVNLPGVTRKSLPLFLYMWLPELTMP